MPTWCKVVLAAIGILIGLQVILPLLVLLFGGFAAIIVAIVDWFKNLLNRRRSPFTQYANG